jgi:LmbE family N-acetylglucosaminyl deacetylase
MISKILFIGAHGDDVELMAAGTLLKFSQLGSDIYYCSFSFSKKSIPEGFSVDSTEKEANMSTDILNIPRDNVFRFEYPTRHFLDSRQSILEDLILLRNKVNPDLVVTHNTEDIHQDHKVISEETYRAFKQSSTIWGYESLKNDRMFNNNIYVKLSSENIDMKIKAISQFKTQLVKEPKLIEAVKILAVYRGLQVNAGYAECFEAIRIIT